MSRIIGSICLIVALLLSLSDESGTIGGLHLDLPESGFHVLIVEQTEDRSSLPRGQLDIVRSVPLRQWLANAGAEFRIWDADVDASRESEWFRKALSVPRESLPWVVASNGRKQLSEPLPQSIEALKADIEGLK